MTEYGEYTFLLIAVPSHIMTRLSLYHLHIDWLSVKGVLLYPVFFILYALIIGFFVFFIRYIRA